MVFEFRAAERLSRALKTAKHRGQVSWLKELSLLSRSKQKSHHSGATARDFHPFPYSPRLPGHPDAFKYKEQSLNGAEVIMCLSAVSNLRAEVGRHGCRVASAIFLQ
jgi:hypothetical protein